MASILRFVDSDLTTVRLTLDFDETQLDLGFPAHSKVWSGNITSDGSGYITGKYENRLMVLPLKVKGTSKADLDSDLRDLITEITRENILEWYPDGGSKVFFETFPYDQAQIKGLTERWYRDAFTVYPFMLQLQAKPFGFGAEETITIVDNLIPNWSMENFTGDDPDDWTVTETAGAGAATVSKETTRLVYGSGALSLVTTAANSVAKVETTAFITVDATKHYCMFFNYLRESGSDSLDCVIRQFTSAGGDLSDDITISPTSAADDSWQTSTTVIHAAGEGGNDFHADCAKVKIYFRNTGAAADLNVDGIVFTISEYLSGNEFTNPLGIVLPPAALLGDVPAPVDMYLSKFDSDVETGAAIYVGGRKEYHASFTPFIPSTIGTTGYTYAGNQGDIKTMTAPGELLLNGDLETYSGSGATADWDNWTETRPANSYIYGYTDADDGYAVAFGDAGYTVSPTLQSDLTAADRTQDHQIAVRFFIHNISGLAKLTVQTQCYNGVPTLLSTITNFYTTWGVRWRTVSVAIPAGTMPVGTTQVRVLITMQVGNYGYNPDNIYVGAVSLQQTSSSISFEGETYSDYIKGFAKPFLHYKLSAAQSKTLDFQGKLKDASAGDINDYTALESGTFTLPSTYTYQEFDPIEIPTATGMDGAATTNLKQSFLVLFDSSITGATTVTVDDLSLIPCDNGYAAIPAHEEQYLIIDCQSDHPGIMVSQDGTAAKAVRLGQGGLRDALSVNPQDGSNFAALIVHSNASGTASFMGQFISEVTLKYRPRYLLVK